MISGEPKVVLAVYEGNSNEDFPVLRSMEKTVCLPLPAFLQLADFVMAKEGVLLHNRNESS